MEERKGMQYQTPHQYPLTPSSLIISLSCGTRGRASQDYLTYYFEILHHIGWENTASYEPPEQPNLQGTHCDAVYIKELDGKFRHRSPIRWMHEGLLNTE